MGDWVRVAERCALAEGKMIAVEAGGRRLVIALEGGRLRAFNALCPHASASLAEGDLRPGRVICWLHSYRFDLASGVCLSPRDGPRLRVYEAEIRVDEVWVKIG